MYASLDNRHTKARRVCEANCTLLDLRRPAEAVEPGPRRFGQRCGIESGHGMQCKRLAPAMEADFDASRLSQAVDLNDCGQSAAPVDVGLQDGVQPTVDQFLEATLQILMLAAGERNGDSLDESRIAVEVI